MNKDITVSIGRAIAIICMVAGHSWINSPIEVSVNLFDMTLFYLVSGYCFKDKYLDNVLVFLKRRIEGLWVPYVKWGIISVLLHNIFLNIGIYSVDIDGNPVESWYFNDIIKRILGCLIFGTGPDGFLGGYWFLKDMFFAVMIAFISLLSLRKYRHSSLLGGGMLLILSVLRFETHFYLPYIHTSTILSASIFCIGYYMNKKNIVSMISMNSIYLLIISALSLFLLFLGYIYFPIKMSDLNIEIGSTICIITFFIYSILSSLSLLSICQRYKERINGTILRMLCIIGDNTLLILTFHMLSFKLLNYFLYFMFDLQYYTTGFTPTNISYAAKGWWVLYTLLGIFIPISSLFITSLVNNKRKC